MKKKLEADAEWINKINPKQKFKWYGKTVGLLPFLTGPEKDKIIKRLKNEPEYCFKCGDTPRATCGRGWYLHYNDKVLSCDELITLFKKYFPEEEIKYYQ